MTKTKIVRRRKWLNLNGSDNSGFMVVKAPQIQWHKKYHEYAIDNFDLTISDCYRTIHLDMTIYNDKTYKQTLRKIGLMVNELEWLRNQVILQYKKHKDALVKQKAWDKEHPKAKGKRKPFIWKDL